VTPSHAYVKIIIIKEKETQNKIKEHKREGK